VADLSLPPFAAVPSQRSFDSTRYPINFSHRLWRAPHFFRPPPMRRPDSVLLCGLRMTFLNSFRRSFPKPRIPSAPFLNISPSEHHDLTARPFQRLRSDLDVRLFQPPDCYQSTLSSFSRLTFSPKFPSRSPRFLPAVTRFTYMLFIDTPPSDISHEDVGPAISAMHSVPAGSSPFINSTLVFVRFPVT